MGLPYCDGRDISGRLFYLIPIPIPIPIPKADQMINYIH